MVFTRKNSKEKLEIQFVGPGTGRVTGNIGREDPVCSFDVATNEIVGGFVATKIRGFSILFLSSKSSFQGQMVSLRSFIAVRF